MSNNTESNTSINIKELLYDNQRLSLLVVQLNKKLDSLQKENDKCHELINLLNKSKEEYKMEMKLEKAKIMNQLDKIKENYKIYSESHKQLFVIQKDNVNLKTENIISKEKIRNLSNIMISVLKDFYDIYIHQCMKQLLRPNTALQSEIEDTIIKYRNRFNILQYDSIVNDINQIINGFMSNGNNKIKRSMSSSCSRNNLITFNAKTKTLSNHNTIQSYSKTIISYKKK